MTTWRVLGGDVRDRLGELPDRSVQCVVTSPPYWGLRDYGIEASVWGGEAGCAHVWGDTISVNATNHTDKRRWNHTRNGRDEEQPIEKRVAWLRTVVDQGNVCQACGAWRGALGLEPTPALYVAHIVSVFADVWRVLKDDGTCWINLGDTFCSQGGPQVAQTKWLVEGASDGQNGGKSRSAVGGLKPKDLVGIPWRVAFALQAAGWYLRADIIWAKPNPMPESVTDRPTKAHEYLFLLSKRERYYYDAEAIREPHCDVNRTPASRGQTSGESGRKFDPNGYARGRMQEKIAPGIAYNENGRNKRSVWTVPTQPYPEAHFATYPEELITPCVLAGSRPGDVVLDPFCGSGTTGVVAIRHHRDFLGIELNSNYLALARTRIGTEAPLFSTEARCPTTRVSVSDVRGADQPNMFSAAVGV